MMRRSSRRSAGRLAAVLAGAVLLGALQGCATRQNPDPLESWNRKVFAFNETLDSSVLKPMAEGYKAATPEPVRTAFANFLSNIKDVWSTANLFLQGRFKDGTLGVIRVTVNSTFGLGGLIDIATPMQLDKPNEDFGQTLGVWGVKPGAYIVWPLLGPSTLRDSVGIPGDMYFSASTLATYPREANVLRVTQVVHTRASLLDAGNLIDDVALDKYAFIRDAYLQRRQNLIYNGDPPEDEEPPEPPRQDLPEPPAVPASGAASGASSDSASAPISALEAPMSVADAGKENPWAMFP
ncbi:VacJ family lipoprotein [Aquabacterium sp. NJ1]|uniref:MlaA family lipoprotein n=1 Tax=Aquabacterium sp. NJ1 TaxID=1538295 RepID=UPI000AFFD092|nr:VacJ family lipoprotein [Aquabacterium sp. NJ1]